MPLLMLRPILQSPPNSSSIAVCRRRIMHVVEREKWAACAMVIVKRNAMRRALILESDIDINPSNDANKL